MTNPLYPRQSIYDPALKVVAYHYPLTGNDEIDNSERLETLAMGLPVLITDDTPAQLTGFKQTLKAHEFNTQGKNGSGVIILDLNKLTQDEALAQAKELVAGNISVLVKNIDDWKTFHLFKAENIAYLQGKFLTQPTGNNKEEMMTNNLVVMELLSQLQNPDIQIEKLEELISRDIALSYKLLKYINSAAFALKREVDSIKHAIIMLGLNTIVSLANLMLMSNIENKPRDLFMLAMTRAKMCENLSLSLDKDRKDIYFTTGLFSVIDALTDSPVETAINQLPLVHEIKEALLSYEGALGQALQCSINLEQGSTENINYPELDSAVIQKAYLDAVEWSNQASSLLHEK